jgi:hypothetical protein
MMSEANSRLSSKLWLKERLHSQLSISRLKTAVSINSAVHREVLFQWLFDVCYDFKTTLKTPYLACSLIERFLAVKTIPSYEIFELLGIVCISISAKYVESLDFSAGDLEMILNKRYSESILRETEKFVLIQLEWKLEYFSVFDVIQEIVPLDQENREKVVFNAASFAMLLISDQDCLKDTEEVIALSALDFSLNYFKTDKTFLQFFEDLTDDKERIFTLTSLLKKKVEEMRKLKLNPITSLK